MIKQSQNITILSDQTLEDVVGGLSAIEFGLLVATVSVRVIVNASEQGYEGFTDGISHASI